MSKKPCGRRCWALVLLGLTGCLSLVAGCLQRGETSQPGGESAAAVSPVPRVQPSPAVLAKAPRLEDRPVGHQRMVTLLRSLADEAKRTHIFFGHWQAEQLRAALDALPQNTPVDQRVRLLVELGKARMNLGDIDQAIQTISQAYALVKRGGVGPTEAARARFYLGMTYLRLGEVENCCVRRNEDSCIVPIRGGGLHDRPHGSREAVRYFRETIETADSPEVRMMSRWLLNIAYMTLGEYPQGVPKELLIDPAHFAARTDFPRFVNIAARLGLDTTSTAGGAAIDDFNNDGYLDIFTSTWDLEGSLRFFLNNSDGSFTERSSDGGLDGLAGALNMVQADYNNDGFVDVYLLRGAWAERAGRYPDSLLRNNGAGTFTDVTFDAGLGDVHYPALSAGWADYDNDGDLDLYVGNETTAKLSAPCQLFRNNGNGTFTDVAPEAGVTNDRHAKGVTWGDYNGDRWPDLYVSNLSGPNRLYRNEGDGTFVDVAPQLGVEFPMRSFPTWFFDYDNDGNLDLFVSTYDGGVVHVAAHYLGIPPKHEPSRLYRGDGQGGFVDMTEPQGLMDPMLTMGCNFGDLDGDGFLDFYLGTGDPSFESLMPNLMYLNQQGHGFRNVTMEGGFGHLQKGHGVAFADLDHDGDLDVFEKMGGAVPGDQFSDALYENPNFGNNWLSVQLVGVKSNRSAIGARLRLTIQDNGKRRTIYRHVNSGGSFGCNPLRQTIGIGKAKQVERIEVYWPTTDRTQVLENVAPGQVIRIVEGQEGFERLDVRSFEME